MNNAIFNLNDFSHFDYNCPISGRTQSNPKSKPMVKCLINYDEEFAQQMNWICSICADLLQTPEETKCGHIYCNSCLRKSQEFNNNCPICREPIHKETIRNSLIIERQINNLKIKCIHHELGCAWFGMIIELKSHLYKNCDFQMKLCCNQWFDNKAYILHLEQHIKSFMKNDNESIIQHRESELEWKILLYKHYSVRHNMKKAIQILISVAKMGHPGALFELAVLYEKGVPNLLERNHNLAFELLRTASSHKSYHAMYKLASYYVMNLNTSESPCEAKAVALNLLHESAANNFMAAHYSLGEIYYRGLYDVPKNVDLAYRLFSNVIKNCEPGTQYHVSSLKNLILFHKNHMSIAVNNLNETENNLIIKKLENELRISKFLYDEREKYKNNGYIMI